jgi:hypothetical protein
MTWRLKARIVEQDEMAIAGQRLKKHAPVATDMHTTMEELLDTVFSMQSMRGYIESTRGQSRQLGTESWAALLDAATKQQLVKTYQTEKT